MKKLLFILIFITVIGCSLKLKTNQQSLEYANDFYDQLNLKKSHQALESILAKDNLQNELKCEILRKLAHQEWKYYQKYVLAKKRLISADNICKSNHEIWMLMSRIERESQQFKKALTAATKAKSFALSETEINDADNEFASVAYNYSVNQIIKGKQIDLNLLTDVSRLLYEIVENDAGMPEPSKLLLGISLLNNDGEKVLKAWKSYFQIQNIENVHPYLESSAKKLNQIHKNWHGNVLSIAEQETLIEALASSRFYEFIPIYVKNNNTQARYKSKIKDIIIYSHYLQEVENETNEYYRLIAIQQADEAAYIEWLNNRRKSLWNNLTFTQNETYSENEFLKITEDHFGARGFTGSTGNYDGFVLSLGHIVKQEKAQVEQYGYKPEFIYTELDLMTSNGYSSWFWEDKAIGGWATENEIIRVREVYLNGPFAAWKTVNNENEIQKNERIINAFVNNTSTNSIKLSEGLAITLRFNALKDLYSSLSSSGLSGQELKLAFLSKYEKFRRDASLLAHEGRHSIERKYMPEKFAEWNNEIREFHAKLSQIVFSPEPRLELSGMVDNFMGDSGHAKANKAIVDIAVKCVSAHKSSMPKYSNEKSDFAQVHLLTIKQIKECYKKEDPLNVKKYLGQTAPGITNTR
ncbi:hypothetical protein [Marinicella sp. W31]|uniref:hypothetical protein n=1 Tax=Marinicella sp. W31 TaxID=3023713 RepID=UPI003758071D